MSSKIAILGYGSQGRAWALNLKDSKCNITVGIPSGDKSRKLAKSDGQKNISAVAGAVKDANIIIFAFPDHLHGQVWKNDIRPHIQLNSALLFLHGYSIHFQTVVPPEDCDVILLAPLGPGLAVREKYLSGESIGYFYSIHQNGAGKARQILDIMTEAMKIDKKAMIKTSFEEETIGDLFGEQAVLCGGMTQLIKYGFETLVESGLSPDKAYLEVAYQLDLIIDLIKNYGIEGMYERISIAAKYGSYLNGPKIIDSITKKKMKKLLAEIKEGKFAEKLDKLNPEKIKNLNKNIKKLSNPSFEKSAKKFSPQKKS